MVRTKICNTCEAIEVVTLNQKSTFKLCGRCKATYYCSEKCQFADWSKHSLLCVKQTEIVRAEEVMAILRAIDGDLSLKKVLYRLISTQMLEGVLGLHLTVDKVKAGDYHSAEIGLFDLTADNRVNLAVNSAHFFRLLIKVGNMTTGTVMAIEGKTEHTTFQVTNAIEARERLEREMETVSQADEASINDVLSKPHGSIYYKSRIDGKLYCMLFGSNPIKERNNH